MPPLPKGFIISQTGEMGAQRPKYGSASAEQAAVRAYAQQKAYEHTGSTEPDDQILIIHDNDPYPIHAASTAEPLGWFRGFLCTAKRR
jgi:hypothetical protein